MAAAAEHCGAAGRDPGRQARLRLTWPAGGRQRQRRAPLADDCQVHLSQRALAPHALVVVSAEGGPGAAVALQWEHGAAGAGQGGHRKRLDASCHQQLHGGAAEHQQSQASRASLPAAGDLRAPALARSLPMDTQQRPDETCLRQRAQALQAARHGGSKAPLAAQRREQQTVLRAMRLVGAVGAPKLLDRLVGCEGVGVGDGGWGWGWVWVRWA